MDIVFIALTLIFFALSWALVALCDRLMAGTQNTAAHESK